MKYNEIHSQINEILMKYNEIHEIHCFKQTRTEATQPRISVLHIFHYISLVFIQRLHLDEPFKNFVISSMGSLMTFAQTVPKGSRSPSVVCMKSIGFKTVPFLLWFLLVHLLKQSLGAPGPHVSTLGTQRLDLDEPFKTLSFLLWFLV